MAFEAARSARSAMEGGGGDGPHTFKSHPQPPPDERLEECRNFLADEDTNRCLGFQTKLSQIDEYTKYLEESQIHCNQNLLRDVKTMAAVHHEWMDRFMDAPPCDKGCCEPTSTSTRSHRFVSKETTRAIEEEREAMGLRTQMREDHAPFTVTREDQIEFLRAMRRDASANPETFDEETNLMSVESRAYHWALKEPSLIPIWMHRRLGLPNKGIKPFDELPWYRKEDESSRRYAILRRRPRAQRLPNYLQNAQDEINRFLKIYAEHVESRYNSYEARKLDSLLRNYEPPSLKRLRAEYESLCDEPRAEENDSKLSRLRIKIEASQMRWLLSFAKFGVQLMVGEPPRNIRLPGVFYVPPGQPSTEDISRLKRIEARANELLNKGVGYLAINSEERDELISYLQAAWTRKMRNFSNETLQLIASKQVNPLDSANLKADTPGFGRGLKLKLDAIAQEFSDAANALISSFLDSGIRMKYQRPGEMVNEHAGVTYIPWPTDLQFVLPQPSHQSPESPNVVKKLESDIHRVLDGIDVWPTNATSGLDQIIDDLLQNVMYPSLRKVAIAYHRLDQERQSQTPSQRSESDQEFNDLKWQYKTAYDAWINSFVHESIEIKVPRPGQRDENPGILYLRDEPEQRQFPLSPAILEDLAAYINDELKKQNFDTDIANHPEDSIFYLQVANLQYPKLKRMDKAWREGEYKHNPTDTERMEALHMRKQWRKAFNAWVVSFRKLTVEVRRPVDEDDGDPSVLYFRGPILDPAASLDRELDPLLTRRKVDHALFLLNWFGHYSEQKEELAARIEACLPPSILKLLRDYKLRCTDFKENVGSDFSTQYQTFEQYELDKKNALVSAFTVWETKIRELARPQQRDTALDLPPAVQRDETQINRLLEYAYPTTDDELTRLNSMIAPYWEYKLTELQERRRSRMRDEGKTDEEIDQEDMGIDSFPAEFEDFKMRCRARGFKIIQPSPGTFIAQDPEPGEFVSGRLRLEALATDPDIDADTFFDTAHTNDIMEFLSNREKEINELLSNQNEPTQPGSVSSASGHSRTRSTWEERRLIEILRIFFPSNIARLESQVRGLKNLGRPTSVEGAVDRELYGKTMKKQFLEIYEPWIRKLATTGVRISLHLLDEDLQDPEEDVLYIRRKRAREEHDIPAAQQEDNTTHLLHPGFRSMQQEINDLLGKRRIQSLDLAEEKRLRHLLRSVMPSGLKRLDDQLRIIANRAKYERLYGDDVLEYYKAVDGWREAYYPWVNGFTNKGIRLKRGVPGDEQEPPNSNVMILQIARSDQLLDDIPTTPSLPIHIQKAQDLVNRFLKGDKDITEAELEQCRGHLKVLWEPHREELYQEWRTRLYQERGIKPTEIAERVSPRVITAVDAAIEAQLRNSFSAFMQQVPVQSNLQIRFVEVQPEFFKVETVTPMSAATAQNQQILETVMQDARTIVGSIPSALKAAQKDFFSLTEKLQDIGKPLASGLTEDERKQVEDFLQPLPPQTLANLELEISALLRKFAVSRNLSREERQQLRDLSLRQMWHLWGNMNPEIRDSTLALTVVKNPDPVGNFLNPMQPGARQRPPPFIDPPTLDEMTDLEILMNNLLAKSRDGTLDADREAHLSYLLQPLMPVRLRYLSQQIKRLSWKAVSSEGLNTNENLRLVEFRRQFDEQFQEWKEQEIESYGVLLDTWWWDQETMQDVFESAWLWNKAMENIEQEEDRRTSIGPSLNIIEDEKMRDQHVVLETLQKFADNYENTDYNRLLLEHMDEPLKEMYKEIGELRDISETTELSLEESLRLRTVTGDFIRDYADWYSRLLPEQIRNFKSRFVDFSGKAEWRGVQRASIELALNLLATNQEQHRPQDRFRRVQLPAKYLPPQEEVSLCRPLEPWKRPVELHTFEFTKLMRKFREWKDHEYYVARDLAINDRPGQLQAPVNYNGPYTLSDQHELQELARKRQNYLAQIHQRLLHANDLAPRPLLERLCMLTGEAITLPSGNNHELADDVPLTVADLATLNMLLEPSWNEEVTAYRSIAGFPEHDPERAQERAKLDEFEADVENTMHPDDPQRPLLPLYQVPPTSLAESMEVQSEFELFDQPLYNPRQRSSTGTPLIEFIHRINTNRLSRTEDDQIHLWTHAEATIYLRAMHRYGRIHFDETPGQERISRIPLTGHPENKFVLSKEDAEHAHYIHFNEESNQFEVQYDADGVIGVPIVQPNKYEYLQRIAFRVGRDIRSLAELVDKGSDDRQRHRTQLDALHLTLNHMGLINPENERPSPMEPSEKEISLQKIARDLIRVAPELVKDAQLDFSDRDISDITEREAAQLIQMQLIEESNNNWEDRFPDNEHVWDWVDEQTPATYSVNGRTLGAPRQFFNMRNWPVHCQSMETQTRIMNSGPTFPEEVAPEPVVEKTAEEIGEEHWAKIRAGPPRERYMGWGGPTHYPFGETPFQEYVLSRRMEEDLKDVPEFKRSPPPRRGILSRLRDLARPESPPVERFKLPDIPEGWNPDNVSLAEKRFDIIEKAKSTPGFPTFDEAYYTPEEVAEARRWEAWDAAANEDVEAVTTTPAAPRGRPVTSDANAQMMGGGLGILLTPEGTAGSTSPLKRKATETPAVGSQATSKRPRFAAVETESSSSSDEAII